MSKEAVEAFDRAIPTDPQQPHATGFDLIDQRQIFMSAAVLDLIYAMAESVPSCRLARPHCTSHATDRYTFCQLV